jgi:hypothetical protein
MLPPLLTTKKENEDAKRISFHFIFLPKVSHSVLWNYEQTKTKIECRTLEEGRGRGTQRSRKRKKQS